MAFQLAFTLPRCTCPFLFVSLCFSPIYTCVWLPAGRVTSLNIVSRECCVSMNSHAISCTLLYGLSRLKRCRLKRCAVWVREVPTIYTSTPYKKNQNRWQRRDLYTVYGVLNAALFLTFSLFVFTLLWLNNLFTQTNKQTEQRRCSWEPRPVLSSSSVVSLPALSESLCFVFWLKRVKKAFSSDFWFVIVLIAVYKGNPCLNI